MTIADYIQIELFDPDKAISGELYVRIYIDYFIDEFIEGEEANQIFEHIYASSVLIAQKNGFEVDIWKAPMIKRLIYKTKSASGFNEKEMKDRGWTNTLLKGFYPQHNFVRQNPLKTGYRKQKMRYKGLVRLIEKTESFKQEKERVSKLGRKRK